MKPTTLCAVTLLVCAATSAAAQNSCRGQCGAEYYRGYSCQCDYSCLSYGECCRDFKAQCTTRNSCRGRCGETFQRGRGCSCDINCQKYKQCCPDFNGHCDGMELPVTEASDQASADDRASPPSYPQDEDIFSDDEFSDIGFDDPEASPVPESTSGYAAAAADPLDQLLAEPTQDLNAVEVTTEVTTEPTQADADLATINPTNEEAFSISTAAGDPTSLGTNPPQPTTPSFSTEPTNPEPEAEAGAGTGAEAEPEATPEGDLPPEEPTTDPTVTFTDAAEVTTSSPTEAPTSTGPTLDSSTVPTDLDSTTIPTGPPTPPSDLQDEDTISQTESTTTPEASTTNIPASTAPPQATEDVTAGATTADPLKTTPVPTKPAAPSKPQGEPQEEPKPLPVKPVLAKPGSRPEAKPVDPRDYQSDDSNDTDLCSGRPIGGVTTLRNGTIAIFRGHFFWFLDRNRVPGPAHGITQVWGVPSPIDTVFTRCNCQGKTYIFKGSQYWRFENDVLDPDYPKVIETGFDGLRGHITAALSVPQYRRRRESVYFFKRGGAVQKYSYQVGTTPSCASKKPQYSIYTVSNRIARQAAPALGPTINIRASWRGFPSTVTAAVSVPSRKEPEGYKYYLFSRSKSYKVRMDGEQPAIAAVTSSTSPQSSNIFKCPKKV